MSANSRPQPHDDVPEILSDDEIAFLSREAMKTPDGKLPATREHKTLLLEWASRVRWESAMLNHALDGVLVFAVDEMNEKVDFIFRSDIDAEPVGAS